MIETLRLTKHRAAKWWWWKKLEHKSQALTRYQTLRPYQYDAERYFNTFLAYAPPPMPIPPQRIVPDIVWCIWSGDNPMTPNREAGLASIRTANPTSEVILVTPDNLDQFVVPSAPLHPIYPFLSYVHRSDYLRGYLLHHHGGAYSDIKRQRGSLSQAIRLLNQDPDRWVVGGPQPQLPAAIDRESPLERDCRHNFAILPSGGGYAARAYSPLTYDWQAEVSRRCDYFLDLARRAPGGQWGLSHPNIHHTEYPIHWNALQANVFEPLCLKYNHHVHLQDEFRPQLHDYR